MISICCKTKVPVLYVGASGILVHDIGVESRCGRGWQALLFSTVTRSRCRWDVCFIESSIWGDCALEANYG